MKSPLVAGQWSVWLNVNVVIGQCVVSGHSGHCGQWSVWSVVSHVTDNMMLLT